MRTAKKNDRKIKIAHHHLFFLLVINPQIDQYMHIMMMIGTIFTLNACFIIIEIREIDICISVSAIQARIHACIRIKACPTLTSP
jgi:hypothetical protein